MAASSLPPTKDDRSPSELVEELFAAYDYDKDGVLCFEELADFRADTTGQQLSQSMFSEFLTLPDSSNATRAAGQKQGFSRGQMVTLYEESQDSQRALGKDHARALEPSLDSWSSIGFAAVVTLQLGRALRRALRRSLAPLQSVPTGGARQVKTDVGRGPARVRAGWLVQPSASEQLPPLGRKLPPLTFIDLSGSTDVAAGLRDGGPQRKDTVDADDFELFPPQLGSRNWPEGGAGDGAGGSAAEEDSVFGLGSLLGAIRSIWPGAKASEVGPPLARPPIPPRGSLGTTGDTSDPKKGTARERAEEVKRQMLQQLARLSMPVPEPKDNLDNDVSRAYKSVRDFKVLKEEDPSFVKMEDFRGSPDVKKQLVELVEMLQKPERYAEVGAKPPKGVLMCGEPGTGKTFAARAVASEAGVPFLAISGSDFRQSPFSGVGTSMTLKMLDEARKKAPCIIFIDEIDSLGEARRQGPTAFQDAGEMGGSVTRDQDANLNALLAKMDGVQPTAGVLFLAATNRPEVLDEALLRTGRFDMRIEFKLPDASSREEILRGCSSGLNFAKGEDLDIPSLAKQTPAFSPADLQGLMNSAALAAARAERGGISTADVEASLAALKKQKAKARPEGSFQVTNCVDVSFSQVRGHDEAVEELRADAQLRMELKAYEVGGASDPKVTFRKLREKLTIVKDELSPYGWRAYDDDFRERQRAEKRLIGLNGLPGSGMEPKDGVIPGTPLWQERLDSMLLVEHLKKKIMTAHGYFVEAAELFVESHAWLVKDPQLADKFAESIAHVPPSQHDRVDLLQVALMASRKETQAVREEFEDYIVQLKIKREKYVQKTFENQTYQLARARKDQSCVLWSYQTQKGIALRLDEVRRSLTARVIWLESESAMRAEQLTEGRRQFEEAKQELTEERDKFKKLYNKMVEAHEKALEDLNSVQGSAEDMSKMILILSTEKNKLTTEKEELEAEKTKLLKQLADAQDEIARIRADVRMLRETARQTEGLLTDQRQEVAKLESDVSRLEGKLDDAGKQVAVLRDELEISRSDTEAARQRLEPLKREVQEERHVATLAASERDFVLEQMRLVEQQIIRIIPAWKREVEEVQEKAKREFIEFKTGELKRISDDFARKTSAIMRRNAILEREVAISDACGPHLATLNPVSVTDERLYCASCRKVFVYEGTLKG